MSPSVLLPLRETQATLLTERIIGNQWMISAALCIALVLDTILTVILIVFLRYNRGGFAK